jgi:hypothetical protein
VVARRASTPVNRYSLCGAAVWRGRGPTVDVRQIGARRPHIIRHSTYRGWTIVGTAAPRFDKRLEAAAKGDLGDHAHRDRIPALRRDRRHSHPALLRMPSATSRWMTVRPAPARDRCVPAFLAQISSSTGTSIHARDSSPRSGRLWRSGGMRSPGWTPVRISEKSPLPPLRRVLRALRPHQTVPCRVVASSAKGSLTRKNLFHFT